LLYLESCILDPENEVVTIDQTTRLQTFIRSTLGCGCPDEVLRSIDCSHTALTHEQDSGLSRIDVGGQLLVYVLHASGNPHQIAATLPAIVASGLVERDGAGFNRLRIVVAADDPATFRPIVEQAFAQSAPADDRLHLHVVQVGDLPFE
jgi:hypothetical protein